MTPDHTQNADFDADDSAQLSEHGLNNPDYSEAELLKTEILARLYGAHTKARTQAPEGYGERQISPEITEFGDPNYHPKYVAAEHVYGDPDNLPVWATPLPQDPAELKEYLDSLPRNPGGPTGIFGPGELGAPINWAADPIVMTINPESGDIYQIQILRDIGEWGIPGGMVDSGETKLSAALRELEEETGVTLSEHNPVKLYQGYVDDYRNTDTHWIQSSVFLFPISWEEAGTLKFETKDESEGIKDIRLRKLDPENINDMFASHSDFIKLGLCEIYVNITQYADSSELQQKVLARIDELLR